MAGLADILSQAAGPDTTDDPTHTPDPAAAPAAPPGLSDLLTQASQGKYTPETPAAPTDHLPPLEGTTVIPAKTTPSTQYGRFTVPEHTDPERYQWQPEDITNKIGNEATLGTGKYLAAGLGAASRLAQGQDPNFSGQLNDIRQSIHRGEAELGPEQGLVDYGVPLAEAAVAGPAMAVEKGAAELAPAAESAVGRVWQAGKKFMAPIVKNAGIGAGIGATSGAANTEGPNWMDYVYGAGRGAAVGATLGVAIPGAIKTVGALGNAAKGLLGQDSQQWANAALREAMQADGISQVDANRKIAAWVNAGSKPETILDLGGDAVRRLGRVVYTQGGKGASGLQEMLEGRASGRVDRLMGDFGEAAGTPERNVVYEQPRLETEAGQATAGAQTAARQSFQDVAGRPAGTRTVGQEAGATIRTALDAERQRLQQARSAAAGPNYGNVRGSDAAVNTDPVTATFADQMVQHEGTPIGSQLTSAHDLLFTKTPDGVKYRKTSMPQMQGALAAMNDQAYGLGKNTSAGRAVGEMAKTLKTQIDSADTSLQQANAAYRTASTPLAPFNDPQMGHAADILAQDQYRTGHIMPDEQVPARYFNPGKTASSDMQEFRQLAGGNPDAVRAMRSYIADQAQRASQGANGAFDPQAFGQWVAKHQDALRQFPEIAQDLTSWAQAVTAAGNAATGSQPALMLRAITGGRDFLSTDPEQIRTMLQGMSPAEQEMYRQGAMRALRDTMGGSKGATSVTSPFSGKPAGANLRNRVAAVFGSEENYQRFAQNAAREAAMQRNENFVLSGSQTANKASDVAEGIDKGEMAKAIIKRDVGGILTQLLGFGKRVFQASQGFTRGRTAELSQMMQQPLDPSMIQELQGEAARAAAPLVSGAARGAAGLAGAAGPAVAPPGTPGQRGLPGFAAGGLAGGDDRGADEGGPGSAAGEGGASSDAGSAGHGGNYGGRGGGATDRGGDTAGDSGAGLPGGASGAYNSKPNVMSRSPITGQQLERQADFHNVGNSTLDNIGNYAASLLGFNEIDPTLSGRKALAGGALPGMQADWGFDPAGLIGGVGGAALGFPGLGVVADLASQRLGRPLETNLGPNVFGGSGSTVATDPNAGKVGHFGGLGRQGLKMAQRMNRGGRAGYAGGGLAGQTLVGPDDTPPDDAAIPARYRDAVGQAKADEFLGQGPLDAIRDFGRDQSAADAANMRIFQAKRAGQEPAQGDWETVLSSPMMNFGLGLSAPTMAPEGGLAAGLAHDTGALHGQAPEAAPLAAPAGGAPEAYQGPVSGGRGELPGGPGGMGPSDRAAPAAPLQGLPSKVSVNPTRPLPDWMGGQREFEAAPNPVARKVASDYMAKTGLDTQQPTQYLKVDPERGARVAQAYDEMKHDPNDPLVKASYEALVKETMAQWKAIKKTGLKTDFIKPGDPDPYDASPRLAAEDVRRNNHLSVFSTDAGYGTEGITPQAIAENPLLAMTKEKIGGQPARVNDIFRAVHDYFGHIKEGVGFRADGEENAWNSHARMYSPLARLAMTNETRGQNSWVNWGPHGEANRSASSPDTVYADQKLGILPDWAMSEGAEGVPPVNTADMRKMLAGPRNPLRDSKANSAEDLMARRVGLPKGAKIRDALESAKAAVANQPDTGLFDLRPDTLAETPNVQQRELPRYEPQHGVSERMNDMMNRDDVREQMLQGIGAGVKQGSAGWYNTDQLRQAFQHELGDHGDAAYKRFLDYVSGASPRSNVLDNIRNASFQHYLETQGHHPNDVNPFPYPYGHIAQNLHRMNAAKIRGGGYNLFDNPKPPSFAANLAGNWRPGTMDAHAMRAVGMLSQDPRFLANNLRIPLGKDLAGTEQYQNVYPKRMFERGEIDMPKALATPGYWSSQPNPNEYKAMEHYFRGLGREYEMDTAPTQAAAWTGHGKMTGLGTEPLPFMALFDKVLNRTAYARGEEPKETLRRFIKGEAPLYHDGGAAHENGLASGGRAVAQAFHEVYHNTPKIVTHTAAKFGTEDARKQRVAIALSKARKAGADV